MAAGMPATDAVTAVAVAAVAACCVCSCESLLGMKFSAPRMLAPSRVLARRMRRRDEKRKF